MESVETYINSNVSFAFESIIKKNTQNFGKEFVFSLTEANKKTLDASLLRKKIQRQEALIQELSRRLNKEL
ncbi:MAG: hypothetical protein MUC49_17590 [Raineya sp.]|jgi:hypothetical protein|nr:hypothetical protein [Raineya sp.]